MPISHQPRRHPCTHCHDLVLVAEETPRKLFGRSSSAAPRTWLEHADPSPDGDVFDPVDEACRRAPVR